jgi:hypothetical protein
MPVKLPAPDLGTDAQPAPKSLLVLADAPDAADEAMADEDAIGDEDVGALAAVLDADELHAAAPTAIAAAAPESAIRRRFFTVILLE